MDAPGLPKEKPVIGLPFYSKSGGIAFANLIRESPAASQVDSIDYLGVTESYNGIPTIQTKTKFAIENAGGVGFSALDHDAQGDYSLVNAICQSVHQP